MKRRAFSLVEVILSFCLLTVVLLLVFNLFPVSSVATEKSRLEMRACQLAQSQLDRARVGAFSELRVGSSSSQTVKETGDEFEITRSVSAVPDEDQQNLVGVRVKVTWKFRSQPRELVQEAYLVRVPR